jgi:hypothetical protein
MRIRVRVAAPVEDFGYNSSNERVALFVPEPNPK